MLFKIYVCMLLARTKSIIACSRSKLIAKLIALQVTVSKNCADRPSSRMLDEVTVSCAHGTSRHGTSQHGTALIGK